MQSIQGEAGLQINAAATTVHGELVKCAGAAHATRGNRRSRRKTQATVRTHHQFKAVHKSKAISLGAADGMCQRSASHFLHSSTISGDDSVPRTFERMIPSDVEQKLRVPALLETGVAVTT